jgi:hypothetical protein
MPLGKVSSSAKIACQIVTTTMTPSTTSSGLNGGRNDASGSSGISGSGAAVGAAAGGAAAGVVLVVLLLLLLVVRRRRRHPETQFSSATNRPIRGTPQQQLEQLLAAKVEQLFSLAFAGHFTAEQLKVANESFATIEVPRKCVKLDRVVGQGQSGNVFMGKLMLPKQKMAAVAANTVAVAVKMYRGDRNGMAPVDTVGGTGDVAGEEALQLEARLLHQLRHPHIVQVLAVVTRSLPTLICLEYMQNGDLKTYLRFSCFGWFACGFDNGVGLFVAGRAGRHCGCERRM